MHSFKGRNNILVVILLQQIAKCCHLSLLEKFNVVVVLQSRRRFGFGAEFFQGLVFSYPSVKKFFIIIRLIIESCYSSVCCRNHQTRVVVVRQACWEYQTTLIKTIKTSFHLTGSIEFLEKSPKK